MSKLLTLKQASEYLNVSKETLRRWGRSGTLIPITTNGGHRRYQQEQLDEYIGLTVKQEEPTEIVATYSRVSSHEQKQKGDLDRQSQRLSEYCAKKKMNVGYIYIRTNEYWDLYDAFKLGKTLSIPDREQTYITSEIKRGTYVMIIEIDLIILDNIEKQLQIYFNELNLHIKFNAGIEFYKKEIINFIIPYFDTNNIEYNLILFIYNLQ